MCSVKQYGLPASYADRSGGFYEFFALVRALDYPLYFLRSRVGISLSRLDLDYIRLESEH